MNYTEWLTTEDAKKDVRALRQKTGLSQAAFSEKYGIPKRSIESWETGDRKAPPYVVSLLGYAVYCETEGRVY